ncbi:MAG TPA: SDR family NAD(P)-dependent oxidoreductase [Steroidobacter sp.]|jgi:L-rhamnose 1-dehydrogenase
MSTTIPFSNALVTGASRGIGRATAIRLASRGIAVGVNFPPGDEERAQEVVREIQSAGGKAIALSADISDSGQVHRMIEKAFRELGPIQILVNNAGICPMQEFLTMDESLFRRVHDVNVFGAFLCSQLVARELVARKLPGRFVFLSSISAWVGGAMQTHYCPTKAAVSALMKSLAIVLGPHGINCNAVLPGVVMTDINRSLLQPGQPLRDHLMKRVPLGRIGEPEDIADVILFLCEEGSRYMNGSEVLVDGGMFVNLQ